MSSDLIGSHTFPCLSPHLNSSPFFYPDVLVILLLLSLLTDTHTVPHLLSASPFSPASGEISRHRVLSVVPPGHAAQTHGFPYDAESPG